MQLDKFNVFLAYDLGTRRIPKVYKYLSGRLHWQQRSLFCGELDRRGTLRLRAGLEPLVDLSHDRILFLRLRYPYPLETVTWGLNEGTANLGR